MNIRVYLIYIVLCVILVKALVPILYPYMATGDQKQHIAWMYTFEDPELFPDDLLTRFSSSENFDPPAYTLLYKAAGKAIDPLLFSKILPIFLCAISVLLFVLLGNAVGGARVGYIAGVLYAFELFIIGWEKHFQSGVPRSFAFPLLLSFLYFYATRRQLLSGATVILQSLIYPPLYLSSFMFWIVSLIRKPKRDFIKRQIPIFVGLFIAGLILLAKYGSQPPEFLGQMITRGEALAMPEFGSEGRSDFFRQSVISYLFMGRAGLNLDKALPYIILSIPVGIYLGRETFKVNPLIYYLIISSLLLYAIAYAVLFSLHLPSRYVLYTLPVAMNLFLAINLDKLQQRLKAERSIDIWKMLPARYIVLAIGIISAAMLLHQGIYRKPDSDLVGLIKFFRSQPKDITIAGYPNDMDNIPLLAKRKALFNKELAIPYYKNYYSVIRERTMDFFGIYYSDSPEQILYFCSKYGVDYLVVNREHFDNKFINGKIYYSPFGEHAKAVIKGSGKFLLNDLDDSRLAYANSKYSVVRCDEESIKHPY